jgi:hypothetical protein
MKPENLKELIQEAVEEAIGEAIEKSQTEYVTRQRRWQIEKEKQGLCISCGRIRPAKKKNGGFYKLCEPCRVRQMKNAIKRLGSRYKNWKVTRFDDGN